jgi:hypothetical protein
MLNEYKVDDVVILNGTCDINGCSCMNMYKDELAIVTKISGKLIEIVLIDDTSYRRTLVSKNMMPFNVTIEECF